MMAKMFYTLEETKAALGKNEEEIKQYAREGRLREFRDGPRLMFKADQVEAIKSELGLGGGGGAADIGISDTGAPIGLVDSRSSSASGISLSDTDPGMRSSAGIPLSGSGLGTGTGMTLKDDTALAADLGLSGSMGGVPSPGRPGSSGLAGTQAGRSGVSVFSGDEGESADPSAQTNIASNVPDQINLESVGSGSGLLDLTRESDDTSLGAELLDEIAPGGSKAGSRGPGGSSGTGAAVGSMAGSMGGGSIGGGSIGGGSIGGGSIGGGSIGGSLGGSRAGSRVAAGLTGSRAGTAVGEEVVTPAGRPGRAISAGPMMIEQADPMAPAFAGAAFGATLFVILGSMVLTGAILDTKLPLVTLIVQKNLTLWPLFGIGAGVSVLFFVVGWLIGKR